MLDEKIKTGKNKLRNSNLTLVLVGRTALSYSFSLFAKQTAPLLKLLKRFNQRVKCNENMFYFLFIGICTF